MTDKPDVAAFLAERNIKVRSLGQGSQYTTCPFCSHTRKAAHRKLKCLSVTIDDQGVVYNCHHCGETDANNAKRQTPQSNRKPRSEHGDGSGYGALQRQALARWVNRGG